MENSKEKQIEELLNELIRTNGYGTLNAVANHLYNAGYRKQSEWISVEEKLPPVFDRVIICDKYRRVNTDFFCGKNKGWYSGRTITHWMPLPEAPKMKGGAE